MGVDRLALAIAQVEAARVARGLVDFRCSDPECNCKFGEYEPPIRMYVCVKCRKCGLYSELIPAT